MGLRKKILLLLAIAIILAAIAALLTLP